MRLVMTMLAACTTAALAACSGGASTPPLRPIAVISPAGSGTAVDSSAVASAKTAALRTYNAYLATYVTTAANALGETHMLLRLQVAALARWRELTRKDMAERGDSPIPTVIIWIGIAVIAVGLVTWAGMYVTHFANTAPAGIPSPPDITPGTH